MAKALIHGNWINLDKDGIPLSNERDLICPKCGKPPVYIGGVGYVDACIGKKIDGVESICCGHGIGSAYIVFNDGTKVPTYLWEEQ